MLLGCALALPSGLGVFPWRPTKSDTVDRSYHYRLKASYLYRGQPLEFDIIVGCGVRTTRYKDGDSSVRVGIAPLLYGKKMPDGKGVVIQVPAACDGYTTDNPNPKRRAPAALMPFTIVYDDADKPMFGWGYATDDAYDSPLSDLRFIKATIAHATKEEWAAWRTTEAPKNIVTMPMVSWRLGNTREDFIYASGKPGEWRLGDHCQGAIRMKLTPRQSAIVRQHWPASRPRFWQPFPRGQDFAEEILFRDQERTEDGLMQQEHYLSFATGVTRRTPGAFIPSWINPKVKPGEVYPAIFNDTTNKIYPLQKPRPTSIQIQLLQEPDRKGFLYCDGAPMHRMGLAFTKEYTAFIKVGNVDADIYRHDGPALRYLFQDADYIYLEVAIAARNPEAGL